MTIKQLGGVFGRNPEFNRVTADSVDINGGSIDGTVIGGSTPAAITGTSVASSGQITVTAGPVSAPSYSFIGDTNTGISRPTSDAVSIVTNGGERLRVTSTGNLGIGTNAPTNRLDVNDDSIRVRTAQTPATAGDAGNQGEIAWDADYIYVCVASDTWKRAALSTW